MEALSLPWHLSIHLFFALASGYLVGLYFKKIEPGLLGGLLGGFFIDLDHVLEYFLVFGLRFNLFSFLEGQQFLKSEQIFILFHAWEYLPLLLILAWLVRRKRALMVFVLALAFGLLVHLISDCLINNYPPRNYSLLYRWQVGFQAERILSPTQYQNFIEYKRYLGS